MPSILGSVVVFRVDAISPQGSPHTASDVGRRKYDNSDSWQNYLWQGLNFGADVVVPERVLLRGYF